MIGHRRLRCLELSAAEGQEVCGPCAIDLRVRDSFERGRREGWSACLDFHGLVGQVDDGEEHG